MIHLKKDLNDQINPELLKIVEEGREKWIEESKKTPKKYISKDSTFHNDWNKKGGRRTSLPLPTGEKLEKRIYDEWKVGVSILEISEKYNKNYTEIFEIIEKYKNKEK